MNDDTKDKEEKVLKRFLEILYKATNGTNINLYFYLP